MTITYYPGYSQQQVSQNLVTRTIESITQAYPMVVTTTEDHEYVVGMNVTFLVPAMFGMYQINGVTAQNAQVISLTSNTLTINLDSTGFAPFAYPSPLPEAYTPPSVIPSSSGVYLPPQPLPYGNQDSFEGIIYNGGL